MDLTSVAERVAAIERSTVTLNPQRCLHGTDRYSTCSACLPVCPVGALLPGRPPTLNAEACQTCLACLPVCPTGALSADDAVPALLECAARIETPVLELICQRHPQPELGPAPEATAIRVRGCLAGVGAGGWLGLAALGLNQVLVRADACTQCQWGKLSTHIAAQVAQAQQLLRPWVRDQGLHLVSEWSAGLAARPVYEADNPPVSRRDLFRLAAKRGQVALARAVTATGEAGGRHPTRERQRLLNALAALPARGAPVDPTLLAGPGFAALEVSAACNACGACARACVTGALQWECTEPPAYRLLFDPRRCNGCEACVHACLPEAITVVHDPTFDAVFGSLPPVVVSEGPLMRCERCRAWTAATPGQKLCPPCEFRRKHPFGARPVPPATRRPM